MISHLHIRVPVYRLPTRDVIAEDPGCDDVAARREGPLEVGLGHVLGQPAHVQVRPLDGLAARTSVRNLQSKGFRSEVWSSDVCFRDIIIEIFSYSYNALQKDFKLLLFGWITLIELIII